MSGGHRVLTPCEGKRVMKVCNTAGWTVLLILATAWISGAEEGGYTRARGWYIGGMAGPTSMEIPSQDIQLEGINFNGIQADDSDLGTYLV